MARCCSCTLTRKSAGCLGVICLSFLVLGILLVALRSDLLHRILEKNLAIVPGTLMFPNWQDFPVPIFTSMYFFNVTNADDIKKRGAKPVLVEVGPYVFREYHHKTKLQWNDDNGTVTYQQVRTYKFDADLTKGSLDDIIITLNPPAATVNAMSLKANPVVRVGIDIALSIIQEELFVAKPVRQLLFEGYTDPILTDSQKLPDWIVPQKMDRFGYFYPRNGSDWFDGVFNMYTGEEDVSKLGQITSWNYSTHVPFYPDKCGEVRGAGDFFSPGQPATFVELYSNDLCRPLSLDFDSHQRVDGIEGNLYKMSSKFFANKTANPDNWCFNPQNEVPSGVFNASSCRFGAPIFMSQPHFYQADPYYLDQIESGLSPVQEKHETAFFVEPKSGLPVQVTARFQVNFRLQPISQITMFKNLKEVYFPTVWFETKVGLPKSMLEQIWVLANLTNLCAIFGYFFIGSALTFSVVVVACLVSKTVGDRSDAGNAILNTSLFHETSAEEEEEQDGRAH